LLFGLKKALWVAQGLTTAKGQKFQAQKIEYPKPAAIGRIFRFLPTAQATCAARIKNLARVNKTHGPSHRCWG